MDNLPTVPDANAVPTAPIAPIVPVAPTPTPAPVQAPVAPTPAPAVTSTQPTTTPLDPSLTPPSSSKKMIMIVVGILVVLGLAYVGYTSMTGSGDTSTTANNNSATPPSLTVKSNGLKGSFSDVETTYNCMQFKDGEVASFKPDLSKGSADVVAGMNELQIRKDTTWLDAVKSIGPETGTACLAYYDATIQNFKLYPDSPFDGVVRVKKDNLATEKLKAGDTVILFVRNPGKVYEYFTSAKTIATLGAIVPADTVMGWSLHIASKDLLKDELAQFKGRAAKVFTQALVTKDGKSVKEFALVKDDEKDTKKLSTAASYLYWVYLNKAAAGVNGGSETPKFEIKTSTPKQITLTTKEQIVEGTLGGDALMDTVTKITSTDTGVTVSVTKSEAKIVTFKITLTPAAKAETKKTLSALDKEGKVLGTFDIEVLSVVVDTTPDIKTFKPESITAITNPTDVIKLLDGSLAGENLTAVASITADHEADVKITLLPEKITAKLVTFQFSISEKIKKDDKITFTAKDSAGKVIKGKDGKDASFTIPVVAAGAPTVASPVIKEPKDKSIIDPSKDLKFEWTAVETLPAGTTATYVTNIMDGIVVQDKFAPSTASDQEPTKNTNTVMPQAIVVKLPPGDYTYGVKTVAIDAKGATVATSPWAVSSFTVPAPIKAPSITKIDPLKVIAKSSIKVTITGENLDPKTLEVTGSTPEAAKVLWLRNNVTGTAKMVEFTVGTAGAKAGNYKYQITMTDAVGAKKTLKEFNFTVDPFITEIAKPEPSKIDPMTAGTISIKGKNFSVGSTIIKSKSEDEKLQISVHGYDNTESELVFDYKDTGAAEGGHVYELEFNYKDGTTYKGEFTIHVNKNTTTISKITPDAVEKAKDFVLTVTGTGFDKVNTAKLTVASYYNLIISEKSESSLKLSGNIFGDVADTIKEATISLGVDGADLATYKIKIGLPASGDIVKVGDTLLAHWQNDLHKWTQATVMANNTDGTIKVMYKDDTVYEADGTTVKTSGTVRDTAKSALARFVNPTTVLKQFQKVVAKGREGKVGNKDLFWDAHIVGKNGDDTYKYGYDDELNVQGAIYPKTDSQGIGWFYVPMNGEVIEEDKTGKTFAQ